MPDLSLTRILQLLPAGVFLWMMLGAGVIFSSHVGKRDPRGLGIALTFWGAWGAKNVGMIPPLWVSAVGGAGLLAALALFQWAAISIRGRMFSYAGNDDLPQFVHQGGPYAYIRNPFYASYLLAELSTVVMGPGVWGAVVVVLAAGYFQWLARFEEEKFSRSPVAAEYGQYKARTGRLWPQWGSR